MRYLYHAVDFLVLALCFAANEANPSWGGGPLFLVFLYPIVRYVAVWCHDANMSQPMGTNPLVFAVADIVAIGGLALCGGGGSLFGAFVLAVLFYFRNLIREKGFDLNDSPKSS